MIYLNKTTEIQTLYIPKVGRDSIGTTTLKLYGKMVAEYNYLSEDEELSLGYHVIHVALEEDTIPGEYVYELSDEIGMLSSGLLVIGDLSNMVEYNNKIQYEQYSE